MPLAIDVELHPLLDPIVFETRFPSSLGELGAVPALVSRLAPGAGLPCLTPPDDKVRGAVRDLLRFGGYKPTGRGKPASEYLVRAAGEGALGSINAAVDACNAVSLHSGLPISVIDLNLAAPPLSIAIAKAGARYVFNASGQEIDVEGLLCLCDAHGPCANAVKDAQRTKTSGATLTTLSVLWGTIALGDRTTRAYEAYRALLEELGAVVQRVDV